MIPYIITPWGNLSTFVIMIAIGIISFLYVLHINLKSAYNPKSEEIFIFPKIVYSIPIAYFFAGFLDAAFKFQINKKMIFSGITFYGGLFGGTLSILLMLVFTKGQTQYTIKQWFDKLTIPMIIFHICGRLGCFFAGCCYGKTTDSFLGVKFPDNNLENIIHHGNKCFPTQLFEIFALIIIIFCIRNVKNKYKVYLVLYAISRLIIEFFRGDNRGIFIGFLSPAQTISVVIILIICIYEIINIAKNHHPHKDIV